MGRIPAAIATPDAAQRALPACDRLCSSHRLDCSSPSHVPRSLPEMLPPLKTDHCAQHVVSASQWG